MEDFWLLKLLVPEVTARLWNIKKQVVSTEIPSLWFSDLHQGVDRNKKWSCLSPISTDLKCTAIYKYMVSYCHKAYYCNSPKPSITSLFLLSALTSDTIISTPRFNTAKISNIPFWKNRVWTFIFMSLINLNAKYTGWRYFFFIYLIYCSENLASTYRVTNCSKNQFTTVSFSLCM